MRARVCILPILLGIACAGCGGSTSTKPASQHTGLVNELPDKKGFFEIDTRTAGGTPAKRGARAKKAAPHPIVVHFYGPDGTTELTPAPTDVSIRIGGEGSAEVPLKPQSGGGFATEPGDYPTAFRGQLKATIDGQTLEAPFMIR